MPLLVRLTDSQIHARDNVFPKFPDRFDDVRCIVEEVSARRLLFDEDAPLSDLHIDPVDWDI